MGDVLTLDFFDESGASSSPPLEGLGEAIQFISHCPECDTSLVRAEGEAAHYCPNEDDCPPQMLGKMIHFVSRKAMNIDGLGEETITLLFQKNLIKDIADFYSLTRRELVPLERMGEKSAQNVLEGLAQSKTIPFERVLFALGIRHIGETIAKKLTKVFHSMDSLMQATKEELTAVDEIGERIAESLLTFFANPKHRQMIERLRESGLQFAVAEERLQNRSDKLQGLSIVISGTFEKHSRDELKEMIEQNGGKNVGSLSAKTSYLLAGDNMGPAKLEKAKKLKLKIISEEEFLEMLA
jgi:DNA ligase (NAD+)